MNKIAIFYGSSTGNTETAAKQMAKLLNADTFDVSSNPIDKLADYDNLIFGTSTWGIGDLQDDWEGFISEIENADLSKKVVAIFGYGDGDMYADSFVDGIGTIYNTVKDKGCKIVGFTEIDSYEFDESKALVDDKFAGLPLDEENQGNMTAERIEKWVEQIKADFV